MMQIPLNKCSMLIMYTFNDKLFPETLNIISGSGWVQIYSEIRARLMKGRKLVHTASVNVEYILYVNDGRLKSPDKIL